MFASNMYEKLTHIAREILQMDVDEPLSLYYIFGLFSLFDFWTKTRKVAVPQAAHTDGEVPAPGSK